MLWFDRKSAVFAADNRQYVARGFTDEQFVYAISDNSDVMGKGRLIKVVYRVLEKTPRIHGDACLVGTLALPFSCR